jgi:hypothetical protein
MSRALKCFVVGAVALTAASCQFSPTAPFSGFDNKGSRVVGRFESNAGGVSALTAQTGAPTSAASVQGIQVTIQERPSLTVTVDSSGGFTIAGVPAGSFTLVFLRDGQRIGEITFTSVRQNQGITITVTLTVTGEVVLIKEQRDQVSFSGECPRGAGFWCQNRNGQNPNLTKAEFDKFAQDAAALLQSVPALDTAEEIAAAVCNTGNQFVRQVATLALNLAAKTVSLDTALQAEPGPYATVGDAFNAAVGHLTGASPLSAAEQEALKNVMDRINNAQNVAGCSDQLPDEDETDPLDPPSASGQMTICHIPPGNPGARHTITIDASAWPSHQGHGDTQGACQ